jgi:hypothetical protein
MHKYDNFYNSLISSRTYLAHSPTSDFNFKFQIFEVPSTLSEVVLIVVLVLVDRLLRRS